MSADKQGYQQSYDAALVGADRSKDIVVLRLLNLQVLHTLATTFLSMCHCTESLHEGTLINCMLLWCP